MVSESHCCTLRTGGSMDITAGWDAALRNPEPTGLLCCMILLVRGREHLLQLGMEPRFLGRPSLYRLAYYVAWYYWWGEGNNSSSSGWNPDSWVVHCYTGWPIMLHGTIIHALLKGGRERYNKVGLTSNSMTFIPNWLQWFKITAVWQTRRLTSLLRQPRSWTQFQLAEQQCSVGTVADYGRGKNNLHRALGSPSLLSNPYRWIIQLWLQRPGREASWPLNRKCH
jgi:hypothetical protein